MKDSRVTKKNSMPHKSNDLNASTIIGHCRGETWSGPEIDSTEPCFSRPRRAHTRNKQRDAGALVAANRA